MIIHKLIGFSINTLSLVSPKLSARIALFLFTKPMRGKVSEKQADFLDTAFKDELTYNNSSIMTYRWLGNKPTILLVHGWESNSARWKDLILNLKKVGHNVVALDAPAHGYSGGDRFNALLYSEFINVVAKRYNPEIIIGHSVGGMASVFYQHKYQNSNIKKLILLGAPSEFKDVLKRYTSMLGYNKRTINSINSTIVKRFGASPEKFSTASSIKKITQQGLIIHDEDDKIIPYDDALLIKRHFKNSTLITTKGLGHSLKGDIVANHIYSFLAS